MQNLVSTNAVLKITPFFEKETDRVFRQLKIDMVVSEHNKKTNRTKSMQNKQIKLIIKKSMFER